VHIGSDILVAEDELVTDPVVAIGGSVTVLGKVNDDVVAVGGSVHLGPKAVVRGDVTSVGGRIDQSPGATINGGIHEVRIGPPHVHFNPAGFFGPLAAWNPFTGWFKLFGTLLRLGLVMLLAMLVALVAARPVERIGLRALQEPWLSGFTGLLAQLLFVPVLVLTVVILAVSLIGIPLLVLVPFGVIAFLLAVLIGFTGVALRLGRWAVGPDRPMFVAMAVGIVLVAVVTLVARVLALVPAPLWPITWMIGVLGFLVEYVAWSVGLGRRCSAGSGRAARRTTHRSRRRPFLSTRVRASSDRRAGGARRAAAPSELALVPDARLHLHVDVAGDHRLRAAAQPQQHAILAGNLERVRRAEASIDGALAGLERRAVLVRLRLRAVTPIPFEVGAVVVVGLVRCPLQLR